MDGEQNKRMGGGTGVEEGRIRTWGAKVVGWMGAGSDGRSGKLVGTAKATGLVGRGGVREKHNIEKRLRCAGHT